MSIQEERDKLLQRQWREEVIPKIGTKPWIRVYQRDKLGSQQRVDVGSVFVPNDRVSTVLESYSWNSYVDSTGPSYEYSGDSENDEAKYVYSRFGNCLGIEPIVLMRFYDGLRPETLEILEEFRLFHNLYFDSANNKYIRHDESGDEIDVVRIAGTCVDVKRKELRQFLTARGMSLVVHIDRKCWSPLSIDAVSEQDRLAETLHEDTVWKFGAHPWDELTDPMRQVVFAVAGKEDHQGIPA